MASNGSPPRAHHMVERFVKELNVAFKAVRLYPPSSAIPRESAATVVGTLRLLLRTIPEMSLSVTKEGLVHEGGAVFPDQPAFESFAREFFARHLAEVRFHFGTTPEEVVGFLRVLDVPTDEMMPGDFESRLWEMGVVNITVAEASSRVVDAGDVPVGEEDEAAEEEWPPDTSEIDEILAQIAAGRPRDQRVLVRLVESPQALGRYLSESLAGRGALPPQVWVTSRVTAFSDLIRHFPPDEHAAHSRSIAEALLGLDEEILRDVLVDRLLGEARHDEGLAEVIRQMRLEEVCSTLASGLEETQSSREGLSRALRNLILLGGAGRDDVLGAARHALEEAGAHGEFVDTTLAGVSPDHITVRSTHAVGDDSPVGAILELVDATPSGASLEVEALDLASLIEEAREGITDGDILGSLVSLATVEYRAEQFNTIMSILEDNLGLLVARGEYGLAAMVAEALMAASEDELRDETQRARVLVSLDSLAGKAEMRAVAAAMRRYPFGTDEHKECRKLLSVLGRHAITPLLEVLADEPDRGARKTIVDLISEMTEMHLHELGSKVADGRWYLVRNVVTVLGSSQDPSALQYLRRTLRHSDVRVRRETIRAAAGIRDVLSVEMLVAALEDSDAQNVQLAARYLGLTKNKSAVPALEDVAFGRGAGNREMACRIEAIEALGRLGASEAAGTLTSLAETRGIRGRGAKGREIRAAARAALGALRVSRRGEEAS